MNKARFAEILSCYNNGKWAWNKGVKEYSLELLENIEDEELAFSNEKLLEKALLNGASDWQEYSVGGCSLIYDRDICARLCSPSLQKKKDYGRLSPNKLESWLDVQGRALFHASRLILKLFNLYKHMGE